MTGRITESPREQQRQVLMQQDGYASPPTTPITWQQPYFDEGFQELFTPAVTRFPQQFHQKQQQQQQQQPPYTLSYLPSSNNNNTGSNNQ
jgi:hypothetical protein